MRRKIFRTIGSVSFALVVVLGSAWQAKAQDAKAPYPSMAPLDQYLIGDRNAEIAMARSAHRTPSQAMPRSWFSDVMVTKPP